MIKDGDQKEKVAAIFKVGTSCYALYFGPRRDKEDPRWVPAIVTKIFGSRSVNVQVFPKGVTWRRHLEQLTPRYTSQENAEPGEPPVSTPVDQSPSGENPEVRVQTAQLTEPVAAPAWPRQERLHNFIHNDLPLGLQALVFLPLASCGSFFPGLQRAMEIVLHCMTIN